MISVHVDFVKTVGRIKPMHAALQPPFAGEFCKLNFAPMRILTDAHIPYSRLHDVDGAFGGNCSVDPPSIFRNRD